jgi:predicted peroxiredoxin
VKSIVILLTRPPYGDARASEAVRLALGAAVEEAGVSMVLLDGGVQLARKGQDTTGTGFTNLGDALRECIDMGVRVYAEKGSLGHEHLEEDELLEGVRVMNGYGLSELIKEAGKAVIY